MGMCVLDIYTVCGVVFPVTTTLSFSIHTSLIIHVVCGLLFVAFIIQTDSVFPSLTFLVH